MVSLFKQHTLNLLINDHYLKKAKSHHLSMSELMLQLKDLRVGQ